MKRILLVLVGAVGTFELYAQISDSEAEARLDLIAIQTKDAISRLVSVTCKDSVVFWKLYDEYQEKSTAVEKSRIQLYEQTALSYGNMNPHIADSLAHRFINNSIVQERTLEEYYEKIKSATNAVTAFEFYQAEVFILAQVRVNITQVTAIYARFKTAAR